MSKLALSHATTSSPRNDQRSSVKPFLKWAGGKTQLLPVIRSLLPETLQASGERWNGRYFEPFMGSAAVFFALADRLDTVFLSDMNRELVLAFVAVRDHLDALLELLSQHARAHNSECTANQEARRAYYARVRLMDRQVHWHDVSMHDAASVVEHAARFIYLNKTCFNGLWRVNSKGQYNVPMGRYPKPRICNEAVLRAAHGALQGVEIAYRGYQQAVAQAHRGDLVYFDPPYMPLSATSSFNAYAKDSFLAPEHRALAVVFLALACRGVHVILSNSDTPFTRLPLGPKNDVEAFRSAVTPLMKRLPAYADVTIDALFEAYQRSWHVVKVSATRAINSKGSSRGAVSEIIVTTHPVGHGSSKVSQ